MANGAGAPAGGSMLQEAAGSLMSFSLTNLARSRLKDTCWAQQRNLQHSQPPSEALVSCPRFLLPLFVSLRGLVTRDPVLV